MKPGKFNEVKDGLRYNTETATLLAHDAFWDGHNWERHFRNQFLYRTPRGRYFMVYMTRWENERDRLDPVEQDEAIRLFEDLPEKEMDFEQAFPGVKVEEA